LGTPVILSITGTVINYEEAYQRPA